MLDKAYVASQPRLIYFRWKKNYFKTKHLLFQCIYVKLLWAVLEKICDSRITFDNILGIEECHRQDRILTWISFLVYK